MSQICLEVEWTWDTQLWVPLPVNSAACNRTTWKAQQRVHYQVHTEAHNALPKDQDGGWRCGSVDKSLYYLPKDLSSNASTHVRGLTTACNSTFRDLMPPPP